MTEADQTRRYTGFDRMPLGAGWRAGGSEDTTADVDPYRGDTLAEIPLTNADDVDAAYRAARDAQREWVGGCGARRARASLPACRSRGTVTSDINQPHVFRLTRQQTTPLFGALCAVVTHPAERTASAG